MSNIVYLTDRNFNDEVLKSSIPVLVDFWAEWCGPCKRMTPLIDEISQEYNGKLKVGKLNVDDNQAIPTKFGIMSIPTLIIFRNGKLVTQVVGVLSKQQLKAKIEESL